MDFDSELQEIIDRMIALENRGIAAGDIDALLDIVDAYSVFMREAENATPRQLARVAMERGMALMEAGRSLRHADPERSSACLKGSASSYDLTEELLDREDEPLRRAKLYFNQGNTLSLMNDRYDGQNVELLELALEKYTAAKTLLAELDPSLLPQVDRATGMLTM